MPSKCVCTFVKPDGSRCKVPCLSGESFCFFHHPDKQQEREEGRRKGGRARMKPRPAVVLPADTEDLPLNDVEEVAAALAVTFNQVRRGELDTRVGNCLGLLAGQLLRSFQGEREVAVTVRPFPPAVPQVSEEFRERILNEVKRRSGLPTCGPKELPAPASAAGRETDA